MQLDAIQLSEVILLMEHNVLEVITVQQQHRMVKLFHVHQVLTIVTLLRHLSIVALVVKLENGAQRRLNIVLLFAQMDLTASLEPHILFHALQVHSLIQLQAPLVSVRHVLKVITAQRDLPLKFHVLIPTIVLLAV
jgi:hypothetical protein